VDVNVHPAKLEVKFSNEKMVFEMVYYAVRAVLVGNCERPDLKLNATPPSPQNTFAPIEEGKHESLQSRQMKIKIKSAEETIRGVEPFSVVTPADLKDHLRGFHVKASSLIVEAPKPQKPQPLPIPGLEEALNEMIALGGKPPEPIVTKSEEDFYPPTVAAEAVSSDAEGQEAEPWRIVGEIFHSYILVEQDDKLVIIDKHAAHERVLFEELKRKLAKHTYSSQILMLPMEATLSSQDAGVLEEYRPEIQAIGFRYTLQGNNLQVEEVPAELVADGAMDLLTTLAVTLGEGTADATLTRDLLFEKALYQGACKAAIKAGRIYPPEYNRELCKKLFFTTDITVCPHGRPVAMTLSHGHIDRQFKRS
jgi:DNA mismatch repair protein MutL